MSVTQKLSPTRRVERARAHNAIDVAVAAPKDDNGFGYPATLLGPRVD